VNCGRCRSGPGRIALSDALFADLYELTMMQAYRREGLTGPAVFSLFVRRLPPVRNYLVACGLETVLDIIESTRFTDGDIRYLSSLGLFQPDFLAWLKAFRFSGDIFAMPEGTPFFAGEPILEVSAPLPEAQLFETLIMNQIHLQTIACSKAARVVTAAGGRKVIDFGARRMHGTDAAIKAARAFYIAGVAATSNTAAGRDYGIPVGGTMGHSYVQAHDSESQAFRQFAALYPNTVLLIDTYDTLAAARAAIELATSGQSNVGFSAVRLDSGDLLTLSRAVRKMLDDAGLRQVQILASGGLDESEIQRLVAEGAPIDSFGVGTSMGVSADAPDLDIAYKLTEYDGLGRMKFSSGKSTLPGRKQVFRRTLDGKYAGDTIARSHESLPGTPLLAPVMLAGRRTAAAAGIDAIRAAARENLAKLPDALLSLSPADPPFPVTVSPALEAHERQVRAAIERAQHRRPSAPED
jgi:nicotinate phosphoribosyltransferase